MNVQSRCTPLITVTLAQHSHLTASERENICFNATTPPAYIQDMWCTLFFFSPLLTATSRLYGIFRGKQWCSPEAKIPIHLEEASCAQHQVAEALYLKAKLGLLTANIYKNKRTSQPWWYPICFFLFLCVCRVYFFPVEVIRPALKPVATLLLPIKTKALYT